MRHRTASTAVAHGNGLNGASPWTRIRDVSELLHARTMAQPFWATTRPLARPRQSADYTLLPSSRCGPRRAPAFLVLPRWPSNFFFVCASSFNLIWTRTGWVSATQRDDAQFRPARTMETFVRRPRAVPRSAHRPSSSRINRAPLGPPQLFVPRLPPSTSTPLSPQLIDTQSQQCLTPPRTSTTP